MDNAAYLAISLRGGPAAPRSVLELYFTDCCSSVLVWYSTSDEAEQSETECSDLKAGGYPTKIS